MYHHYRHTVYTSFGLFLGFMRYLPVCTASFPLPAASLRCRFKQVYVPKNRKVREEEGKGVGTTFHFVHPSKMLLCFYFHREAVISCSSSKRGIRSRGLSYGSIGVSHFSHCTEVECYVVLGVFFFSPCLSLQARSIPDHYLDCCTHGTTIAAVLLLLLLYGTWCIYASSWLGSIADSTSNNSHSFGTLLLLLMQVVAPKNKASRTLLLLHSSSSISCRLSLSHTHTPHTQPAQHAARSISTKYTIYHD